MIDNITHGTHSSTATIVIAGESWTVGMQGPDHFTGATFARTPDGLAISNAYGTLFVSDDGVLRAGTELPAPTQAALHVALKDIAAARKAHVERREADAKLAKSMDDAATLASHALGASEDRYPVHGLVYEQYGWVGLLGYLTWEGGRTVPALEITWAADKYLGIHESPEQPYRGMPLQTIGDRAPELTIRLRARLREAFLGRHWRAGQSMMDLIGD